MEETISPELNLDALLARAQFLRGRIQLLRIDYPEAADARRTELFGIESQIAQVRANPSPSKDNMT